MTRIPSGDDLDELVVFAASLPPGSAHGPTVELPALARMGVESGPRFRAYIAARSLVWVPGKTRRKVRDRWPWSRSPSDYPVLTPTDLRRLAFGAQDTGHRLRSAIMAAWCDLPGVVLVPAMDAETGEQGFRCCRQRRWRLSKLSNG